jgi:hypothetical protein
MVFGRTNHADNVGKIILKFREFFPHEDFARTVKAIAAAHGGRKGLTKAKKQDYLAFGNSSYEVHPLRLAAFLRLADEISENRTRISGNLLDAVPDQNRIFWEYANAIAWSRPDNEALRLVVSYNVDKKVVVKRFQCVEFPDRCDKDGKLSLIEYIICRLEKINNERIYCAQHLPAFARYTELQARISIVDDLDRLPEFDELSFTFRDGGLYRPGEYPNTSIFDSFFSNNEKWKPENLSKHLN